MDFAPGLDATVDWYATRRDWWEPLRDPAAVDERAWTAGPALTVPEPAAG